MSGDLGSPAAPWNVKRLEFCSECLKMCNNKEIFEQPVSISARNQRGSKCRLCRLLLSMSMFAQQMRIDPLRSYDIKILSLVGDLPITDLDLILHSDKDQSEALAQKPRLLLSPASFSMVDRYLDRGEYEKNGVFTMRLVRSVSLQSRLPLLGFRHAETAFAQAAGAHVHKLWQANSTESINPVSRWISDCTQHHKLCATIVGGTAKTLNRTTTLCPVRLIEVEYSTVPPTLRLVEFTKDVPSYITLSHRWSSPQPFKTTKTSLSIHSRSIPFIHLPKTFKSAIKVAHELAVKYIWIDSICIVQDDQDDWRRQSEQMGSIYQMSLCTLAAIDARVDSEKDQGLFPDRDMLPFSVLLENRYKFQYNQTLPDPNVPTNTTYKLDGNIIDAKEESISAWESSHFTLNPNLTTFDMSVELSEWNRRAWIFQERMLSTRVLYFTKEQIFWECAEHITSEHAERSIAERSSSFAQIAEGSNRLHTALRRIHDFQEETLSVADDPRYGTSFFDLWDENQRFRVWWVLVERYSATQLTHNTDKWYAIAGLCAILQSHFQSTIHAGVWENAAGAGILWHARDEALQPYEAYHAPSWSWLGVEGAVKFAYKDESYTGYIQKVKPLYQNTSFSTTDPEPGYGVGSFFGSLTLSCPSRRAGISSQRLSDFLFNESTGRHDQDPPAWKFLHDISHGKSQLELSKEFGSQNLSPRTQLLTGDDGRAIGWVVMDFDGQTASEVMCAAIAIRILNNYRTSEQHVVECVALINSPSKPDSYKRVGRGRIVEHGWLDTCITEVFRIV